MTPVTAAQFREDFPEFADAERYPRSVVDFRLKLASQFAANPDRWGDAAAQGQELWAAHLIALWRQGQNAADRGATPGIARGVVSAESVDKASVSYDVGLATYEGGGDLNLTTYGIEYQRLAKLVGAGPIQVGACVTVDPLSSGAAFAGFPVFNFPNGSG